MKSFIHAVSGVLGFLVVATLVTSTGVALLLASDTALVTVKSLNLKGSFLLPPLLAGVGATGMSLLGKRTDSLALAKQKRGPIGFMTSLLVILPSAYFLSSRASTGVFDMWFYAVQAVELAASALCLTMIGLNIRDGLALRGRINTSSIKAATIEERDGGPLVALRLPVLENHNGQELRNESVAALCRCGASKTKPYCDGSHNRIGFDSRPTDDRITDEVLVYEGKEVDIHYNRLLCSHAAECGKRQKAAFDSSRKPWIIPDNASKEEVIDVVKTCPSGALRFAEPGKEPQHAPVTISSIRVEKNGPYRVSKIPLHSARLATGATPDKYVLCRCGASKNKPYCDGTHHDIGWKSA